MLLVEMIDGEIRIGNEFCFIGHHLVESVTARGIVSEKYRKINMLNIKNFSFVEPYYVALSLIGMSKDEIEKNIISSQLSLINSKGFVFGSEFKIKDNQLPAFLDPSLHQALSFIEIVLSGNEGEHRLFFFDINTDDLSKIDSLKYKKSKDETNDKTIISSKSSCFTTLSAAGERIKENRNLFISTNAALFTLLPLALFFINHINVTVLVFSICFSIFNISSFVSISNSSASKFLLLNPFVSYFCLSKKEYLSILKRGD